MKKLGKMYIDIKGIAKYLNYDAHNGEYKIDTEDTNKCWVECKQETASFFLNSNKISKVVPRSNDDYEDYLITDPIINKNGKLYSTSEGIEIGFNSTFSYNKEKNTVEIYTLPYLVKLYESRLKQYGYEGTSASFKNQKAILYNLFVVRKENNSYGVINSVGEEIIGSRYKSMEFNESAIEFFVKNNSNKAGIITGTGDTKINLLYDEINMIDKSGLYLVKDGNKYGVLGNNGNIIVHLEYEQIGIDSSKFPSNNINNKYVLYDNLIPVCQNKKWGMFDKTGKLVIPVEFDAVGCSANSSGNTTLNNLLLIPSYKAVVLGKTKERNIEYGIYSNTGKEYVPCRLSKVYSITNAGIDTYYMEFQEQTLDIEAYIKRVHKIDSYIDE